MRANCRLSGALKYTRYLTKRNLIIAALLLAALIVGLVVLYALSDSDDDGAQSQYAADRTSDGATIQKLPIEWKLLGAYAKQDSKYVFFCCFGLFV